MGITFTIPMVDDLVFSEDILDLAFSPQFASSFFLLFKLAAFQKYFKLIIITSHPCLVLLLRWLTPCIQT